MGSIDDGRKAVQDFIAPDLKALAVRLEALEKNINLRLDHSDAMNQERLSSFQKFVAAQFEMVIAQMAAQHASMLNTWQMEKRLTRLEGERKTEPQHV